MPDVPEVDNENVGDEVDKEKTINDPITHPPHPTSSSCTTQSFMERKDDIDCEDGADPHNALATAEEELPTSIDQNLFAEQAEGSSSPEVEPCRKDSKDDPPTGDLDVAGGVDDRSPPCTEDIKEASVLWSPRLLLAISIVLVSCCSNVIFLELLVRQDPGIGNLVTFSQFLVIAVEGFVFTTKLGTVGPVVPFKSWITLVVMYFMVSVTNNYALSYHVPMPLHMIFRAGSLMANMLMGMVLLGRRYTKTKYVSVLMITIGIATCTVMSATSRVSLKTGKAVFSEDGDKEAVEELLAALEAEQSERLKELMFGIGLLVFAMLLSARMGIYQEVLYSRHGKHAKEALFYTHALPLPGFLLLGHDILRHWDICLASTPISVLPFLPPIPTMLLQLVGNVIPQYLCISAVFVLTAECPSLTATLVLTCRKFLSLLFSIWYFQNPFSVTHWVGTALVFGGIVLFSDIPSMLKSDQTKKSKED